MHFTFINEQFYTIYGFFKHIWNSLIRGDPAKAPSPLEDLAIGRRKKSTHLIATLVIQAVENIIDFVVFAEKSSTLLLRKVIHLLVERLHEFFPRDRPALVDVAFGKETKKARQSGGDDGVLAHRTVFDFFDCFPFSVRERKKGQIKERY